MDSFNDIIRLDAAASAAKRQEFAVRTHVGDFRVLTGSLYKFQGDGTRAGDVFEVDGVEYTALDTWDGMTSIAGRVLRGMTDNEAARWRQRINSTIHTYLFSIGADRPVHYYDTPLASTTRERGHLLEAAACAFRFSPVWTARQVQVFRDLASYALSLDGFEQRGFLCVCQDLYILPQTLRSIHAGLTDAQVAGLFFRPFES